MDVVDRIKAAREDAHSAAGGHYRPEQDLRRWLDLNCEAASFEREPMSKLYSAFVGSNRIAQGYLSPRRFGQMVRALGLEVRRPGGVRCVYGLALKLHPQVAHSGDL